MLLFGQRVEELPLDEPSIAKKTGQELTTRLGSVVKHLPQAVDSIFPDAELHRPPNRASLVGDFAALASSMLYPRETPVEAIEFGPFGPSSLRTYVFRESNRFADRRLELENVAADCRNSLDRNSPLSSLANFIAADIAWSKAAERSGPTLPIPVPLRG